MVLNILHHSVVIAAIDVSFKSDILRLSFILFLLALFGNALYLLFCHLFIYNQYRLMDSFFKILTKGMFIDF